MAIGVLFGLLSMVGWGISDFLAAKSSRKIGNALTCFWAQFFSFLIVLIYFFLKFQTFYINNIPKFFLLFLLAGFLYVVATLSFFGGVVRGEVSLVAPIGSSYALIIILLSIIFFNEILKANQILGIILIILGIPLLSINLGDFLKIKKLNIASGTKEGLIAMFGWGISLFLLVPASKALGWFLPIVILRLFSVLFLASYIIFRKQSFRKNLQPSIFILLFPAGLLDMVAFFAYSFGVEREYASIVAPIGASFPLVTIVLARIFLKEKLVLYQIIGIFSIITGLILISI